MPWFKADDGLPDNRKVRRAGTAAMGLWLLAGTWSAGQLTDGFVPKDITKRWDGRGNLARSLVRAELWSESIIDGESGFQFINWKDYQPLKAEVEAERAAARERMKKRRSTRKTGERADDVRENNERTSETVQQPRPHPDPTQVKEARNAPPAKVEPIEQILTAKLYEELEKGFKFIAVRGIVKWALHERQATPEAVADAVRHLYENGKPIMKETVGQHLNGIRFSRPVAAAGRPPGERAWQE